MRHKTCDIRAPLCSSIVIPDVKQHVQNSQWVGVGVELRKKLLHYGKVGDVGDGLETEM